jgi:hypothetical protein
MRDMEMHAASDGEKRYSPAECIGCQKHKFVGHPDPEHVHQLYRTRESHHADGDAPFYSPDECFLQKIENHAAAIALHMMHYNFVRIHQTLRTTPAMAPGVTNRLWQVSDLVALLEASERGLERAA